MNWIYSKPPCTGDSFMVKLMSGEVKEIFFCPQQGWIDKEWNNITISDVVKYYSM